MARMPEPPLSPPDDPSECYWEEARDALWVFQHRIGTAKFEALVDKLAEALQEAARENFNEPEND
jgi:hypothetical protein